MLKRALLLAAGAAMTMGGTAFAAERTYEVKDFNKVSVSMGLSAEISVGEAASVRAVGDSDDLERLEIDVRGDELVLRRKQRFGFNLNSGNVTIYVTTPQLEGVNASSGSSAKASGVKAGPFNVDASSGASLRVEGTCDTITADVSSGARIDAEKLECRSANADASSGGSMDIHATEDLVADASSGGNIDVHGGPQRVNIDESSGGDVSVKY